MRMATMKEVVVTRRQTLIVKWRIRSYQRPLLNRTKAITMQQGKANSQVERAKKAWNIMFQQLC